MVRTFLVFLNALLLLTGLLSACDNSGRNSEARTPAKIRPFARSTAFLSTIDSDGDGYSPADGDCDDENAFISPTAVELCDATDNNCDGDTDNAPWVDDDADGFYALTSCVTWSEDCDDNNPNVWSSCTSCRDVDRDSFFVGCDAYVSVAEDCDDTRSDVSPGGSEVCDGFDNDCDLNIDEEQTTPEFWLFSYDTLDCAAADSPFNTVAAWDEPILRISANAHDVTIKNCIMSNRTGAIDLGNSTDVTIENTDFVQRAVGCGLAGFGVIHGEFRGSLTLTNVRVLADGNHPELWRYAALDVDADTATSLSIRDSFFATAAGLRAYTNSNITIERTKFVGNAIALTEYQGGRSDAYPLSGVSALATSTLIRDSIFETYADGCLLIQASTAEVNGNSFTSCPIALDATGSGSGYAYLNDFGPQSVSGPLQLYDSRDGSTADLGNYWGGSCDAGFNPGAFFTANNPPDLYPFGVPVAGLAANVRDGTRVLAPPCTPVSDGDSDGIAASSDCDDDNPNVWFACGACTDADADSYWDGCDAYSTVSGPDCDDSEARCATNCFEEDLDADGATYIPACGNGDDCDDANPIVFPGAAELYDGLDNDCDTFIDELHLDADGDGLSPAAGDCDDENPRAWASCSTCRDADGDGSFVGCDRYFPAGTADCDDNDSSKSQNCETCIDGDGDGFYINCDVYPAAVEDCDDSDGSIYPGVTEQCDDIDNDCDGLVDEALSADLDQDGHYAMASCAVVADDCDDSDPNVWGNCTSCVDADSDGLYTGCDEYIGHPGPDCDDLVADPNYIGLDLDRDGAFGNCTTLQAPNIADCDDSTAEKDPRRLELPCDGIDNDCDGVVDETATADCVPLTSVISLQTPELGGKIERDDKTGEIVHISLLGSAPPAVSANAAAHVSALQAFVATHSVALRINGSPSFGRAVMQMARNNVFSNSGASQPSADLAHEIPPIAVTRLSQYFGNRQIRGADVRITSTIDDSGVRRVRFIDGLIHDPQMLQNRLSHLNATEALTYEDATYIARGWCATQREIGDVPEEEVISDDFPQELLVDVEGQRHVYMFNCRPYVLSVRARDCAFSQYPQQECVDAVDVSVADYGKARATFLALKDVEPWMPVLNVDPSQSPSDQQLHPGVPVDVTRANRVCLYRGTYGGEEHGLFGSLDSEFPYPRTNDAGGEEIYRFTGAVANCSDENDAFKLTKNASFFNQLAHQQLATAAENVAKSTILSLLPKYPPFECGDGDTSANCQKLRVNVKWTSDEGACKIRIVLPGLPDWPISDGRPGTFYPPTEDICLNPRHRAYRDYQTALHEYGHYLADSWGMILSLNATSCADMSAYEGVADAFAISLEHYRRGAHNATPAEARARYLAGPGVAMDASPLSGYSTSPYTTGNRAIQAAKIACDSDSARYQRGMAIGQVMWSLMNNHYCPTGKICGFVDPPTRILDGTLQVIRNPTSSSGAVIPVALPNGEYNMAVIAREAFVHTLWTTGNRFAVNSFLTRMRDFMYVNYKSRMSEAQWARVADIFALHGIN